MDFRRRQRAVNHENERTLEVPLLQYARPIICVTKLEQAGRDSFYLAEYDC